MMKAIILSYEKYLKFAEHTILSYEKLWPSHPFTFRVPYGEARYLDGFKKYAKKVKLIQTDAAKVFDPTDSEPEIKMFSPIKATVLKLLEDIPDDEWIYWCMDDRYIIRIKENLANDIYDLVINLDDHQVIQVNFNRPTHAGYWKSNKFIKEDSKIITKNNQILRETVFTESDQLKSVWGHQFLRAKVLRRLFLSFPDRPFRAKEMDYFDLPKLSGEKSYIVDKNIAIYGESTSRGEITENCVASFKKWGLELPNNMKISDKYHISGELPYQFLGLEFSLPKKLDKFITSVNRWYYRQF